MNSQTSSLGSFAPAVDAELEKWREKDNVRRLWERDKSLWSNDDEDRWLGWLEIVEQQRSAVDDLLALRRDVQAAGFSHVLLLGMGGSSLAPEVWQRTFGSQPGCPALCVLDSTVPDQVRAFERKIDPRRTLVIVASKSGGTIEPNMFKQYFFDKLRQAVGEEQVGSRFVAITDPDTKMHQIAQRDRFRTAFFGSPTIGGRFSALSNFGLVPLALLGVDVAQFLDRTAEMVRACGPSVPAAKNPGVLLGVVLGVLAKNGRDKVTVIASPGLASLGGWLEQLIAESTGKLGQGIVPVDGEPLSCHDVYGQDRVFVFVRLTGEPSDTLDRAVATVVHAGHPVIRIDVADKINIGQEMFRWEIATAAAGAVMGINPFNQPDVEAAKVAARKLTADFEATGRLPEEKPLIEDGALRLYTNASNASELAALAKSKRAGDIIKAHLQRIRPGDYFAINAYVEMCDANAAPLGKLRQSVRDRFRVATTLGFGPRFLHSTGQLHKGGANNGVFLQITCDDAADLPIPGQKFTFGIMKQCQAQGDFDVLAERGRRVLRIHIAGDAVAGLNQIAANF